MNSKWVYSVKHTQNLTEKKKGTTLDHNLCKVMNEEREKQISSFGNWCAS